MNRPIEDVFLRGHLAKYAEKMSKHQDEAIIIENGMLAFLFDCDDQQIWIERGWPRVFDEALERGYFMMKDDEYVSSDGVYKTPCCDYKWMRKPGEVGPIFWNPFNLVVQCHNCGAVFDYRNVKPCVNTDTAKDATNS